MATDSGCTRKPSECIFFCSEYPEIAMHPAKNVMCQTKVNNTARALYWEKMQTARNGLIIPKLNDTILVTDEIVIDTAASDIIMPMRTGTGSLGDVRRQAANITKVSSIPTPVFILGAILTIYLN